MPPSLPRWISKLAIVLAALGPAGAKASPIGEEATLVVDGRQLAVLLSDLRPLAATHMATTWALAPEPERRTAVAQALEWPFPLFGDAAIIEHLSHDPEPVIRAACARAAWARRTTGGDSGVLARLVDDPDPEVRGIAARALGS